MFSMKLFGNYRDKGRRVVANNLKSRSNYVEIIAYNVDKCKLYGMMEFSVGILERENLENKCV